MHIEILEACFLPLDSSLTKMYLAISVIQMSCSDFVHFYNDTYWSSSVGSGYYLGITNLLQSLALEI